MTERELRRFAPLLRSGVVFFALFAVSFYIGYRMAYILGKKSFAIADPFGSSASFYDILGSWVRLTFPSMISFLLIFISAFSPFMPIISSVLVARQSFACGLMLAFLSPATASMFCANLVSSLCLGIFAAISLPKFPALRRISFKKDDPEDAGVRSALYYGGEFLLVSGFCAFVYLPCAVITHVF